MHRRPSRTSAEGLGGWEWNSAARADGGDRDDGASIPFGGRGRAPARAAPTNANDVVSTDRLIDGIWGEQLRERAARSGARISPPDDRLTGSSPSAGLRRPCRRRRARRRPLPRLVADGDPHTLALWRGQALADVAFEPFAQAEAARLEEARLAALEARIDADLDAGRHAALTGELDALVSTHPHRERLQGQRMLALYRAGRQADALAAYRDARHALAGSRPRAVRRARPRARMLEQDPLSYRQRFFLKAVSPSATASSATGSS